MGNKDYLFVLLICEFKAVQDTNKYSIDKIVFEGHCDEDRLF